VQRELGGDRRPDAAVADDHRMIAERRRVHSGRQLGERPRRPLERAGESRPSAQPALERLDAAEDERIERDREQRAGDDQALRSDGQEAERDADRG